MRSRDGAQLKYTSNDAKKIYTKWTLHQNLPAEAYIYLEDLIKADVLDAFDQINKYYLIIHKKRLRLIFFAGES